MARTKQKQKHTQEITYWHALVAFVLWCSIAVGVYVMVGVFQDRDIRTMLSLFPAPPIAAAVQKSESTAPRPLIHPVGFMIDDHFASWPQQAGLSRARIVYHTLVEGGTTRFLAFFDLQDAAARIGPVRSARPYFLLVAEEYNPLFVHVGGSPAALQAFDDLGIAHINEMTWYGSLYLWRDNKLKAPHNVFTSLENIRRADKELGYNHVSDFDPWQYGVADETRMRDEAHEIVIDYAPGSTYDAVYRWEQEKGTYARFQGGDRQIDALYGQDIAIDNLVVQRVPQEKVLDREGRLSIEITGEGDAVIFQQGKVIVGRWKKPARNAPTQFFDGRGKKIIFVPGNVWIEIVPRGHQVTIR